MGTFGARSDESPTRPWSTAASSQSIQESEERIRRAVAARFAIQRLGAGQCSFFEREVGVEVHLRGFDLLASQPQGDHGGVDPGVQ
jgi:hypothetical protein